jgi:hypothetical protein
MTVYIQWALTAVGVAVLLWLASRTVRRARELNERIDEYHREQDELERSGGVIDPYAGLTQTHLQTPKKDGRRRRV